MAGVIDGNFFFGEMIILVLDVFCQEFKGVDICFLLDVIYFMWDEFEELLNLFIVQGYFICFVRDVGECFFIQDISSGLVLVFIIQVVGGGFDEEVMDMLLFVVLVYVNWDIVVLVWVFVYFMDVKFVCMFEVVERMCCVI